MMENACMIRVLTGGVLLIVAAVMDVRNREISDSVWVLMMISAAVFMGIDAINGVFSLSRILISLGFGCVMGAVLYFLNFGGADIKALISISLLYPEYPSAHGFPMFGVPPLQVFVMSVLTNAVIIGLSAPVSLFLLNALRKNFSPLMFLGIKVPADSLRHRRHFRLMHSINNPNQYVWGGVEVTRDDLMRIEKLHREGVMRDVWITPELPFIVFIAAGFFTAFMFGDIVASVISAAPAARP